MSTLSQDVRFAAALGVVIRTTARPDAMTGTLRTVVTGLDPDLPIHDARSMDERISRSIRMALGSTASAIFPMVVREVS